MTTTLQTREVKLRFGKREIAFRLTWDPNFRADQNTWVMLGRDQHCEPEVEHAMVRILRPADYAIDVGANVGFMTLLMSQLVGIAGLVTAVEPGVNNTWKLEKNLEVNQTRNVEVVKSPLHACVEPVVFYAMPDSGENSLRPSRGHLSGLRMVANTIDGICIRSPRLIKIDTEGAEVDILEGAHDTLGTYDPFVICEVNSKALSRFNTAPIAMLNLFRQHGYEGYLLDPHGAPPHQITNDADMSFGKPNANMMFARPTSVEALGWT